MLSGKWKHCLASINKNIYAIGGLKGKFALRDCLKYNIEADNWNIFCQLNN